METQIIFNVILPVLELPGTPPPLIPIVIPGTMTALYVEFPPPLKMVWALNKYPISMPTPSTFLLIRALDITTIIFYIN